MSKPSERAWYETNAFHYTLLGVAVITVALNVSTLSQLLKAAADADKGE